MSYELKWEENGVVAGFNEEFNYAEYENAINELSNNPVFEKVKFIIWDFSKLSESDVDGNDSIFAALHDKLTTARFPSLKIAFCVKDRILYNYFKEYISKYKDYCNGWDYSISDSMIRIRSWVNS